MTELEKERAAVVARYVCAGCGAPAILPSRTDCDCPTNVIFDPSQQLPHAAKDRYFMQQIDTAGERWPQIKLEMEVNRVAVRHGTQEP